MTEEIQRCSKELCTSASNSQVFLQTYVTLKDLNDIQSCASVLMLRSYNERCLNHLMCCEECTVRLGSLVVVSVDTIRFNIVFSSIPALHTFKSIPIFFKENTFFT
jgi:hypothetical protein